MMVLETGAIIILRGKHIVEPVSLFISKAARPILCTHADRNRTHTPHVHVNVHVRTCVLYAALSKASPRKEEPPNYYSGIISLFLLVT